MLPLVQMHPMVQPTTHRDSIPKHDPSAFPQRGHHASRMTNALHGLVSAHRAFPIRASQPSQSGSLHPRSAGFSHHGDGQEHRLRRKTPNGTIDAGYDGTPTQYASGPPPLKHMIFPGAGNHVSSPGSWSYRSSPSVNSAEPRGFDMSDISYGSWQYGSPAALGPDCAANPPSTVYYPYHNGIRVPTALQPTYHHSPGPAVFNNGGLLPAPTWFDAGHAGPQHAPLGMPSYHMMNRSYVSPTPNASNMMARYDMNYAGQQTPTQRLESLTLDPGNYDVDNTHVSESSPAFREKALARAHRSYVDLLAYLHKTKKRLSSRYSHGSKTSRMTIFPKIPKPPKHPGSQPTLHQQRPSYDHAGPVDGAARAVNLPYGPSPVMMGFPQPVLSDLRQPNGLASPHVRVSADTTSVPYYQMFSGEGSHYGNPDMTSTILAQAPVENAKAAVEMLNHLCELSGWKWIDGMLLGGCLYYGLERYEDALEWFTRIVALDDSHTEALSNAAATLYCLHRNDEAERHWLQAVRRDPSYLEAVEHLVGLLCSSQRSKEAVEIIDHVQDALRVTNQPPPPPPRGWDGDSAVDYNAVPGVMTHALRSEGSRLSGSHAFGRGGLFSGQAGFGSSGYRVLGSENGRVIALIHAKGNMLYAHKDISKASEAFEEAVLISAGRRLNCIQALIQQIVSVLSPGMQNSMGHPGPVPLLLPPEKARHTARLVFANNGELPGLQYVPEGPSKRSAVSTTSNSLLSLAKIFQDAMSNGATSGGSMRQPSGVGDILALYYLSLSLSESPSTANNVGILLASVQQTGPAAPHMVAESAVNPPISGIVPGSGLDLALAYYKYGLSLDSKHVHLHTNLGSLLKDIGQLDLAIQMYEQAVACDGTFDIALTNLANAVKDRGRINDAITYYRRAVQSNPQFAEAVCGLFTALNSVCDWTDRGGVILHGGKYDRWHVDASGMLQDARMTGTGAGLVSKVVEIVTKQLADASHWGAGVLGNGVLEAMALQIRRSSGHRPGEGVDLEAELRRWSQRPWEGTRVLRLVERSIKATMRRWYQDKYVHGRATHPGSYARVRLPASLAVPSAPTVLPFHTFTCPLTAKDIRIISQRNAVRISSSTLRSPWLPDSVYPPPPPPKPHLNVGYVSSDFNNHPLAHLMQSVFGMHDPTRAKAFCYATTASDKSCHRQQIEREAPVFRDVSSWSAERLVDQIVKDEIHILVNLNGYTRGARNEIFAARPAPIQMSFMGFAGTLGAEWCDYILADETAVPPSTLRPRRNNLGLEDVFRDEEQPNQEDWVYSENVVFCRDTFFCCDHAQSCGPEERLVTWEQEQQRRWQMRKELFPRLSDDAIILGNFNQLYKIDPATFRTWLRILSGVPNAYLWLLRFPELGETNLRKTARRWASEDVASRIIFTDVAPKQQHIGRARVCDMFLDTPECNAHTTAADVLWSSSPLLTLPRYPYKMCSRMAASILKGALPKSAEGELAAKELIATDEEDYERQAIRLARGLSYTITSKQYGQGHGRLAEIRKILFEAKWSCALFDTRRWVSDLEEAYVEAWRRWVTGDDGDIYL